MTNPQEVSQSEPIDSMTPRRSCCCPLGDMPLMIGGHCRGEWHASMLHDMPLADLRLDRPFGNNLDDDIVEEYLWRRLVQKESADVFF